MPSTLLVAMLCVLVLQRESLAEEKFGYALSAGLDGYSCTTDPLPGECSFDYPVAGFGSSQMESAANAANLKQTLDNLNIMLGKQNISDICSASLKIFFCKKIFQLNCTDEFIQQDIEGIETSCKTAEKDCEVITDDQTSSYIRSMINCSEPIYPRVPPIKRPRLKCERFPEVKQDPFPCPKRNYKVMVINFTEQVRSQVAAHERLTRYSNNISQKCLNDVGEMICKNVAPACDRNETVAVELVSRQECEGIISCLNTTPEVKGFKSGIGQWCMTSPDANTAKEIPLSIVYTKFEDDATPKYDDTKMDTTAPANESPSPTDSKTSAQPTTEIPPYHNTTRRISSAKQPTVQGNISEGNTKSPSSEISVFNGTIQGEKNTTSDEGVPNLNETTQDPETSKINGTISNQEKFKVNPTPKLKLTTSICIVNPNKTAKRTQARVQNKATSHVINVTFSTFFTSETNASFRRPIYATERQVLATVSNSTNVDIQASQGNSSAPQWNAGTKGLPVSLLVSILTVYMW